MRYFIDQEFLEDFIHPWIGKSRHYIDLISIGIVAEDGREYYAVSNEFDIDHVWNKFQIKTWMPENSVNPNEKCGQIKEVKEYWLRDNVLMPIVHELAQRDYNENGWYFADFGSASNWLAFIKQSPSWERTWKPRAKELIKQYGKSNKQIAQEITAFVMPGRDDAAVRGMDFHQYRKVFSHPEFYGYYADYDWVLFCSLYGRMLDLPKGFPMYCIDLKQTLEDRNAELKKEGVSNRAEFTNITVEFSTQHNYVRYQNHIDYPKQINEHNALADARWNRDLYNFLQSI